MSLQLQTLLPLHHLLSSSLSSGFPNSTTWDSLSFYLFSLSTIPLPTHYLLSCTPTLSSAINSARLCPVCEVAECRHCAYLCSLFSSDFSQSEKHLGSYSTGSALHEGILTSPPLLLAQLEHVYFILIPTTPPQIKTCILACTTAFADFLHVWDPNPVQLTSPAFLTSTQWNH